jgi:lipopolysaccharide/colanic/teichoic acid biosynthesis glycosyltransferase
MYEKYLKRALDFIVALISLIILSPILLILSIVGAIVLRGNPFFIQPRPGKKGKDGKEEIFSLIKFRSMSNARGDDGELLPDELRLGRYGKFLRSTSLDELPSLINILKGDLSLCGPRPQLVRDMVFMTDEQRRRHDVRPGLTGLAQINGRNNITWEKKFEYDLQYINDGITFFGDLKIMLRTILKVLKRSDINREGTVSDMDYGDWLLNQGKIDLIEYTEMMNKAKKILMDYDHDKE